ncbi:MAG: putative Ig domain-containing protein [bacterium]|nr:putative Ig domain-containing protein [bacterium]
MSREYTLHRYFTLTILCILLFSIGGCKTGNGADNIGTMSPTISIVGLKNLEFRSTFPVTISINSSGDTIVTLAIAVIIGPDGQITVPTPLPGRMDPSSLQQLFVPAGGTDFTFWWNAIADLESGQVNYPIYIRATITTTDGRISEFTFGPMTVDLTDTLGGALPPYVPGMELPSSWCGAYYDVPLPIIGGYPPFEWSIEPAGTHLPYMLELSHDGTIHGTFPLDYGPITIEFNARVLDSNPVYPRESAGHFTFYVGCEEVTQCGPPPEILFTSLPTATEGEAFLFQGTASGGYAPIYWEITSGTLPDSVSFGSDCLFSGTPNVGTAGSYPLTIQVTDSCPDGARTDTVDLTLTVEAKAPGCDPGPIIVTSTLPGGMEGVAFNTALSAQGGHGNTTWSLASGTLPAGVHISANGNISGTPEAGTGGSAGQSYTFNVEVCDSCPLGPQCDSRELVLLIAPPGSPCAAGPEITSPSTLNPGTERAAYLFQFLASGGEGSKTWTINNPTELPSGLDFNNQGKLSGTPADGSASTYNLDITVSDSCPEVQSDNGIFALTINASLCADAPVLTITNPDPGEENVAYSYLFTATGGEGALTWTQIGVNPLPTGLTLETDGTLHGTPASGTASTYEVEIQVEDECPSGHQTDSNPFNLVINPESCNAAPTISNTELASGLVGRPYEVILMALGGEGVLTWEILTDADALPTGLSLVGKLISGTPVTGTEGTYNLHIQVCDSCPTAQCADNTFQLVLYPACAVPPVITNTSPLDNAYIGTPYSIILEATGGEGTLTWEVLPDGDDLPSGLQLIGNEISGTPDTGTEGTYIVKFGVCDECGIQQCDDQYLAIPVGGNPCAAGPTILTTDIPKAVVGVPFSFQFDATGGEGALHWITKPPMGSLPPPFILSPTGVLSGTAIDLSVGSYNITIVVTDSCWSGGQSDQKLYTFEVGYSGCAAPPEITNLPSFDVPAGGIVNLILTAINGEGALTWSLENIDPLLPGSITIDPTGRIIGTTDISESGTYTFDIKVCDECTDPAIQCGTLTGFTLNLVPASGCSNPPPSIVDITIPEAVPDGTAYSYMMTVSDGDAPLIWSGFGFPSGLHINPFTGEISGSTTDTGLFNIYIGVLDSCAPIQQADSALYVWTL